MSVPNPTIIVQPNSQLSIEYKRVLEHMFTGYTKVIIKSEFDGGLSGGRVFLVHPVRKDGAELSSVVKIDEVDRILKEWESYQSCIRNRLPDMADIRERPVYPPGSRLGGLWYPLIGSGIFDITSLYQYYSTASLADLQYVLEERLFKSLRTLWQENQETGIEFHLQTQYDIVLPVNLVVEAVPLLMGSQPFFLRPETVRSRTFQVGDYVQMFGFRIVKINRKAQQLSLDAPEGLPFAFRFHLRGITDIDQYMVGQELTEPVIGVIRQTRADQLLEKAQDAVGKHVDFAAMTLTTTHHSQLPNPLVALPRILSHSSNVYLGYIHGDLNLENILVEPKNRNAYLIDFAHANKNHILRDLLHLEMAVITKILSIAFTQSHLNSEQIISFYKQLHCVLQKPDQMSPPSGLEKPFAFVQMIRQAAQPYLFKTNDWTEYYYGLVIYLLGALRFDDLDELPTTPLPKQMAFWGAAAILGLLDEQPDCSRFIAPPPKIPSKADSPSPVPTTGTGSTQHKAKTPSTPTTPPPRYQAVDRITVLEILRGSFNDSELQDLCLFLGIDYDNLAGSSKGDKARELLLYCERRGLRDRLVDAAYSQRPNAKWYS